MRASTPPKSCEGESCADVALLLLTDCRCVVELAGDVGACVAPDAWRCARGWFRSAAVLGGMQRFSEERHSAAEVREGAVAKEEVWKKSVVLGSAGML